MKDGHGRVIDYLRISLTDRCNFRCVYCMPEEGVQQLSHFDILRIEEVEQAVRIATTIGIKKRAPDGRRTDGAQGSRRPGAQHLGDA